MNAVPPREIHQKAKPVTDDPEYLAAIHNLPCIICEEFGMVQNSPTEAHHTFSERWGNYRTPDCQAIPLCHSHHTKMRPYNGDEDKIAIHRAKYTFTSLYGPDADWIEVTQERISL